MRFFFLCAFIGIFLVSISWAISPQDQAIRFYMSGMSEYQSKNYELAAQLLQRALELDSTIEAQARNIKLILGISAFHAGNDILALNMLQLFPDNPLAVDFMGRIAQRKAILEPGDSGFQRTYLMEPQSTKPAAATPPTAPTSNEFPTREMPIFIFVLIFFVLTTILFILEIKWHTFSRFAFKILGANVNISIPIYASVSKGGATKRSDQISKKTDSHQQVAPEEFMDTPTMQEVDIAELASRTIDDVERFFEEEDSEGQGENDKQQIAQNEETDPIPHEADQDAKSAILGTREIFGEGESKPESEPVEIPPYQLQEPIQDGFDFDQALSQLKRMVKEEEEKAKKSPPEEKPVFVSVEEVMDEPAVKNMEYFQKIEQLDDEELREFLDMIFDSQNKEHSVSNNG